MVSQTVAPKHMFHQNGQTYLNMSVLEYKGGPKEGVTGLVGGIFVVSHELIHRNKIKYLEYLRNHPGVGLNLRPNSFFDTVGICWALRKGSRTSPAKHPLKWGLEVFKPVL